MKRRIQFLGGFSGIVLLLAMNGTPLRAQSGDTGSGTRDAKVQADSAYVTKLLSEAKWRAALADYDAETLLSYSYSNASWESHAVELRTIAGHVNDLGNVVKQLNDARGHAAPWQQVAIDRINPLLNNMATNLNATINHLRENQQRVNSVEYRDYLQTNADLASRTSTTISEFVEYSRDSQKTEALQKKLELPAK